MWVQLLTTCSNFTEVAQLGAPSCNQPQPAMDNGVRDGRSNWLVVPLSSTYCTLQCGLSCKSQDLLHWVSLERVTFGVPDQHTACAATWGIKIRKEVIIIYHDFLPTPWWGSHVKSDKTHTIINIHPLAHILDTWALIFSICALFTVYPNGIPPLSMW